MTAHDVSACRFLVGTIILLQSLSATSQAPVAARGSIEGIVVRAGTGDSIPGARVVLASAPIGSPVTACGAAGYSSVPDVSVVTDAQGKFEFRELNAGSYCVAAGANGFAKQLYGQRTVSGPGAAITLASGKTINNIQIPLPAAGSISGRIRDSAGQPATGISVQLLKSTYNVGGQRVFQPAGAARTDDRGDYRLYWITPGRYYLFAGGFIPGVTSSSLGSPNEIAADTISPTFYISASDIAQATVIDLKPAADIGGVDLFLPRPQLYRIRGRLIDGRNGQYAPAASVTLVTPTPTGVNFGSTSSQSFNPQDGTFEIRDVTPGLHVVRAQVSISSTAVTPATGGIVSTIAQNGSTQIALNVASDINSLSLVLVSPVSVSGQVIMEGAAANSSPGVERVRVQLRPSIDGVIYTNLGGISPSTPLAAGDGTFRIDNVLPGEYRPLVSPLSDNVYIKQARFNQNDILSMPMKFLPSDNGKIEIVLSARGGQIDGVVVDDRRQPVASIQAVLVPDRQRERTDLYKSATTDSNGRFSIRGIAPGDYHVFSWESIEPYSYFDPELIRPYESKGTPVHITESAKEMLDLKLIPAE